MRASVLVLGPLVARYGQARVSLPGGCAIGARPVDQHLKGLEAMGAEIELEHGYVDARRARRLRGAQHRVRHGHRHRHREPDDGGGAGRGRTTLENAAREPEVEELARVLNTMGARIEGAGTSLITIEGVDELHADRAHASSPTASRPARCWSRRAITGGDVLLRDCLPEHLDAVIAKLRAAGAEVAADGGRHPRARQGRAHARPTSRRSRIPGFPTDMQAQFMVLMTRARGQSVLTETIFENRFMHVPELQRMGADIARRGPHGDRARADAARRARR